MPLTKLMRLAVPTLAAVSMLIATLPGAAFAYGNGSSFTVASGAAVDIADKQFRSVVECSSLIRTNAVGLSIISTELVARRPDLAEHCLVYGVIAPEIQFTVQLPSHWNGRLYVHGNGGDAGESVYGEYGRAVRERALANGFVATFSDTGHARADFKGSRWAFNSVQRELDYSYRALHLNTVVTKQLIEHYYGRKASHSYFDGCSTGGGQGLRAAQRYPEDFDGIVAGAPVFDPANLLLYVWNNQLAQQMMQMDAARLATLGDWVMQRFDAADGVADGVISDPSEIDFDPRRDLPRDASGKNGYTEQEISGLALAYGGLVIGGKRITPGVPIGAELAGQKYQDNSFTPAPPSSAWLERILPDANGMVVMQLVLNEWLRYVLFEVDDPTRDWRALDLGATVPDLKTKTRLLGIIEPDLRQFQAAGGKLLIYNGWGDVGVNPYSTIDYYQRLKAASGGSARQFARLFLVPGMFHCGGGLNVDRFDAVTSLIAWVEGGNPPKSIEARRVENGNITRTRLVCAYPQVATYRGRGSTDAAANFVCTSSKP